MSAAPVRTGHLVDRLPRPRGRIAADAPLAPLTWFRVGGPAEVLFRPADEEDLAAFLAGVPDDVPVTVVGVASNLLVRDGGVRGVVVRLPAAFGTIAADGGTVTAGAAALDLTVARTAQEAGIAGLEFLAGIPGTIGGAVRMNGGAYGRETKDALVSVVAVDRAGRRHEAPAQSLGLSYRHSGFPADWIVTSAVLRGEPGAPAAIAERIEAIQQARADSQPIRARTGGSTFANPDGMKAWELIDRAGCRGLAMGGARVSEKHCNFLINEGTATAADLEALGEEVRRRVREASGIELRWEIKRIGEPAPMTDGDRA